jgi:unsaturated rhamnogalacturonyl hydrolase
MIGTGPLPGRWISRLVSRFFGLLLLVSGSLFVIFGARAAGDNALSAASPLDWSMRFAKTEMARDGTKLESPPAGKGGWDYTTGFFADALIRLSNTTGDLQYEKWAEATIGSFIDAKGNIAIYQQRFAKAPKSQADPSATPAPGIRHSYTLDDIQSAVAALKLYDITHDEKYHQAALTLRNQLLTHPRIPEGGFWHKSIYVNQMWLDGLYMAEPFYASYAVRFNEPKDFDDIAKQFALIGQHNYDPTTGLFYHAWDEAKKQKWADPKTGLSPNFWGRAMGWYAMALVDVLDLMPKDHPARANLLTQVQEMAGGIIKYQDPKSGVWWQVVNDGGQPHNYLETSASCMFVYFLAKGINEGYLPATDTPAAKAGFQGLLKQFVTVDAKTGELNLNNICKVAGLDKKRDGSYRYYTQQEKAVSNDLKGIAAFMLAGMECEKLFGNQQFAP